MTVAEDHKTKDHKTLAGADTERRRIRRHRTLKGGSIAFNNAARIDCRVRNLSPLGACLELETSIGVPDSFVLVIDSEHARHPCRVVWREPRRLGIEFLT